MKIGAKVKGVYCGSFEFEGTLESMRVIQISKDAVEFTVTLDRPIVVYGDRRDQILVYANWYGKPSSYCRTADYLQEVA